MTATLRYEFLMQIRRPSLWIVYGLVFAVLVATLPYLTLDLGFRDADLVKAAMTTAAKLIMTLLPIVYGCMVADRLVRDRRLGVDAVLDSTPAGRTGRLIGKYVGVCAATAVPLALVYFGRAVVYTVTEGKPAALGWSAVVFLTSMLPGLIYLGALALIGPLLVPPMLFRVLFVIYWFWGNLIPATMMPTLSRTIFSATGDYASYGFFLQERLALYEGEPEAALDFLRPAFSPAVAWLWMGVMVALAVALLSAARLHAIRSES
ncbi:hypothetical protein [Streptosporangium sp. KLBMP 9127]|nr:hypothetical protein [Streptosporangium sp. KLBMP 9127]